MDSNHERPDGPKLKRRSFLKKSLSVTGALGVGKLGPGAAPGLFIPKQVSPVVISDSSGYKFKNGGSLNCIERAFQGMSRGERVIDCLVEGVAIPEADPEELGVGYGGLPNAEGVVQLDASCMDGATRRAGGVAAIEGIRHPAAVAKAVMEVTDHHLLVGEGAQRFARRLGHPLEDLSTPRSRQLWLEWKRRVDPLHYLDPAKRADALYRVGLEMIRDGVVDESHYWGTVHVSAINGAGDIAGVTSTSGLSWKIPGRTGDSPILGAGLYVDGAVGACGSTGRGEANLFNLSSFLVVEKMREGLHPKDAAIAALERVRSNTVDQRLLNDDGKPNFNLRIFALNNQGDYAGCAMYAAGETVYGVCTEAGSRLEPLVPLLDGAPD